MIKAIFLDVDNTLLDFDGYVRNTLKNGFAHFQISGYREELYDIFTGINDRLWRQIETGELDFENLKKIRFDLIFREAGVDFDGPAFETYFREQLYESAIPIEGACALLKSLSVSYLLYAASNGPYEQQCHRLDIAGMSPYFSGIFISEKVGADKPSKAFYDRAFSLINRGRAEKLLPSECLAVGDSMTSDIKGGREYGMKTCYYAHHGSCPDRELTDLVAEHLSDIPGLIEKL